MERVTHEAQVTGARVHQSTGAPRERCAAAWRPALRESRESVWRAAGVAGDRCTRARAGGGPLCEARRAFHARGA